MPTLVEKKLRQATPILSGRILAKLVCPDKSRAGDLAVKKSLQGIGTTSLMPLSILGMPITPRTPRKEGFLTPISVIHKPRKSPGIQNLWCSSYTDPEGRQFAFHRSGTFCPGTIKELWTIKTRNGRIPNNLPLEVDLSQSAKNLELLCSVLLGHRGKVQDKLLRHSQEKILLVDLKSAMSDFAESTMTTSSSALAEDRGIRWVNIPVRTTRINEDSVPTLEPLYGSKVQRVFRLLQSSVLKEKTDSREKAILLDRINRLFDAELEGRFSVGSRCQLAAHIIVLGMLCDFHLHVSCRGGRHRTSLVDGEVKFLLYQLCRDRNNLKISAPCQKVLDVERRAWNFFMSQDSSLSAIVGDRLIKNKEYVALAQERI